MDGFKRRGPASPDEAALARQIRRRLLAALVICALLASAALAIGLAVYLEADRASRDDLVLASDIQNHLIKLDDALVTEVLQVRTYLITGDEQAVTRRDQAHQTVAGESASLQTFVALLTSAEPAQELQDLMTLHANYDALAAELISLRQAGQAQEAVQLFDKRSDPLVQQILMTRSDLQRDVQAALVRANQEAFARSGPAIGLIVIVFLAGAAISIWLVMRLLAAPLQGLEYMERALIETAQAQTVHPVRLPVSVAAQQGPMFQAYNVLITRLEDNETSRLHFLSHMIHALQTQLATILGYAALLESSAAPPDGHDQYARIIVQQARQMEKMLGDMVTVSLIDEERFEVDLEPLYLMPLVASVVEEARQHSGRTIQFDDRSAQASILGDALQLRDVLTRLIDNALKFSPAESPVQVTLQPAASSGSIELSVGDHGIGIAEADQPLLFRRFGRIRNKQTQRIPGSGLGLYLAQTIVQRHHGQITVRSQPGQGTDFIVTLPLIQAEGAAQKLT